MTGATEVTGAIELQPPVGVIGGVGPLATAYFMDKVVRLTDAATDQAHVDMLVFNHATIPDRTAYIAGASAHNPGPVIVNDARRLERFGVSFLVVPCNTAHYFSEQIAAAVQTPLLSMVDETVVELLARQPHLDTVGLLATRGTAQAGVYQQALASTGVGCVLPGEADQARLTDIIYDQVKAGRPVDIDTFREISERMFASGCQAVILGCTELSVLAEDFGLLAEPQFVDSLHTLARSTITRAGHRVFPEPHLRGTMAEPSPLGRASSAL